MPAFSVKIEFRGEAKLRRAYQKAAKKSEVSAIRAGFWKTARYESGAQLAYVALKNELGNPKPRAFMRTANQTVQPKLVSHIKNRFDGKTLLFDMQLGREIGIIIENEIRIQVKNFHVIDTGFLFQNVASEVIPYGGNPDK